MGRLVTPHPTVKSPQTIRRLDRLFVNQGAYLRFRGGAEVTTLEHPNTLIVGQLPLPLEGR